jgi:predicted lipid-binding transport protein (Tim44 family)
MARRRHILGGLLVAMAATLFVGLLPTFRLVLVVHLFVVDSFLAYVGLLVHLRDREARRRRRGRAEPQAARDRVGAPEAVVGPSEPARSPAFGAVTVAAPRAIIADLADSA